MNILSNPSAFADFYDATAIIAGKRRETGASTHRLLSLAVPACVLGCDPVDASNGSIAPVIERSYTILIRRADWPDHLPPQSGDVATIAEYPILLVQSVAPDSEGWTLACISKGGPA